LTILLAGDAAAATAVAPLPNNLKQAAEAGPATDRLPLPLDRADSRGFERVALAPSKAPVERADGKRGLGGRHILGQLCWAEWPLGFSICHSLSSLNGSYKAKAQLTATYGGPNGDMKASSGLQHSHPAQTHSSRPGMAFMRLLHDTNKIECICEATGLKEQPRMTPTPHAPPTLQNLVAHHASRTPISTLGARPEDGPLQGDV